MLNWTYSYNPQRRGRNRFAIEQKDVSFEAKMALLETLGAFIANPMIGEPQSKIVEYHARDAMKAR